MGADYFLPFTKMYNFSHILDIGSGKSDRFVQFFVLGGKQVDSIDLQQRHHFSHERYVPLVGDFVQHDFHNKYDAIWASHVLEHVQNTGLFLNKVYDILDADGIFFCIVPPHKRHVVGGHVSCGWNIGILMYNLILTGFDVKNGHFKKYGYNIGAFVRKRHNKILPNLLMDKGDIERLADFWPNQTYFKQGFDGNMDEWNWFD